MCILYDQELEALFKEFVAEVEVEYKQFKKNLNGAYNVELATDVRADYSVKLAQDAGVDDNKIMHTNRNLDKFMRKNHKF